MDAVNQLDKRDRIWITMALCWSKNTEYHGKGNFPYADAAPLSAQLWMRLTPAKAILQVQDSVSTNVKRSLKHMIRSKNSESVNVSFSFVSDFRLSTPSLSPPADLLAYKSDLEEKGVLVKLEPAGDMKCVLKAQLIRLIAFELEEVRSLH